jgi:hypothetical protein
VTSLAGTIEALAPHVPASLISAERLADIRAIAAWLPSGLSPFFGFECRLGAGEPRADFLVRVSPDGQRLLAGANAHTTLAEPLRAHPLWQRLRALCAASANGSWPLANVWLEFDVAETGGVPAPSVFLGPQPWITAASDASWITDDALPRLLGRAIDRDRARRLTACITSLPAGASIFQMGAMLPRGGDALRLCVLFDDAAQVARYLDRVGWRGRCDRLAAALSSLPPCIDAIAIGLDVNGSIGAKVGVECYAAGRNDTIRPDWTPFLDHLAGGGLCTAAKRDGLLAWPGCQTEPGAADLRREEHDRLSALAGPGLVSVLVRWLHHVKLAYDADRMIDAKAYLAVRHRWIRSGPRPEADAGL